MQTAEGNPGQALSELLTEVEDIKAEAASQGIGRKLKAEWWQVLER